MLLIMMMPDEPFHERKMVAQDMRYIRIRGAKLDDDFIKFTVRGATASVRHGDPHGSKPRDLRNSRLPVALLGARLVQLVANFPSFGWQLRSSACAQNEKGRHREECRPQ